MATNTFAYAYQLNSNDKVLPGNGPGHAGNPYTGTGVTTGPDSTLEAGDTFAISGFGSGTATFLYASGDGFAASFNGNTYWLTNTAQTGNSTAPNDGDSYVVCFLPGTLIATPAGAVAIETLQAGDLVLTADGVAKPVRWLARQSVSTVFADPMKVMPILIRAGALGDDLPARDLYVSPDHALELDGVLVQAGALVNGSSITRHTDMPKSFTYYHVELDDHSLILAEGVAAETFVDNVARRAFDNWQEAPEAVADAAIAELDLPRVKSARQLPTSIRARLAARAGALGLEAGKAA